MGCGGREREREGGMMHVQLCGVVKKKVQKRKKRERFGNCSNRGVLTKFANNNKK